MLFNSIRFVLFFPAAAILYYLVPYRWRHVWLVIVSYFFYMCFNPAYGILLFLATAATYVVGLGIEHARRRAEKQRQRNRLLQLMSGAGEKSGSAALAEPSCEKAGEQGKKTEGSSRYGRGWLLFGLIFCLGILFFFKYFNFIVGDALHGIQAVFPEWGVQSPALSIALPVGISFYTFQALGYTFEVYKGKIPAEKSFIYYAAFVSFFPLLCAGPIERAPHLLPQFREKHRLDLHKIKLGLYRMLWGYFQKMVISDRAAILVSQVFGNYETYSGFQLVTAAVMFGLQIYGDFAGYSNLAAGAAEVMGFEVMTNFDTPYLSRSVGEFWRRWHIALSSWFRDYLYFSLGGSRCSRGQKYRNIMIVFLVSGLWHGAGWNFIIWGGLNGLFQVLEQQFEPQRAWLAKKLHIRTESLGHKIVQTLITFCLVDFAWIFFNAADVQTAFGFIERMFTTLWLDNLFGGALFELGLSAVEMHILIAALLLQLVVSICTYKGITVRDILCRQGFLVQDVVVLTGIFIVLIFGIYGPAYNAANFIYMQF